MNCYFFEGTVPKITNCTYIFHCRKTSSQHVIRKHNGDNALWLKLKEKGTGIALKVGSQASEFWIHFHHREDKKNPKTPKKPQSADL